LRVVLVQVDTSNGGFGVDNTATEWRPNMISLFLCISLPRLGQKLGHWRGVGGTLYTRMILLCCVLATGSRMQGILRSYNLLHSQLNNHTYARNCLNIPSCIAKSSPHDLNLLHHSLNRPPSLTSGYTSNRLCVYSGIPFLTSSILPFANSTITVPSFSSNCPNTSALGSTTILCPHAL
jgi:hypothetical protein